jgi:glycosyltransferase involved in cell wall biosynthesis
VVIPVSAKDYRWLPDQLDRLVAQEGCPPFEVVVADNAGMLEPSHRGERVVLAVSGTGAGYARNVGAAAASGEYLLFCDADDLVDPGWVGAHVAALASSSFTAGAIIDVAPRDPWYPAAIGGSFPGSVTAVGPIDTRAWRSPRRRTWACAASHSILLAASPPAIRGCRTLR